MRIVLGNGWEIENPLERIREYIEIEVYRGYDDRHSVDNNVSERDVDAADLLYAGIKRYGRVKLHDLVGSRQIAIALSGLVNVDLGSLDNRAWDKIRVSVGDVLMQFTNLYGVGLAIATKILHLKRPKLFPVLDSFVVSFLLDEDLASIEKSKLVEIGLKAMDRARDDLMKNSDEFNSLRALLSTVPIQLETVRMYDILCWTTEKWNVRKDTHAKYGSANRSLALAKKVGPTSKRVT